MCPRRRRPASSTRRTSPGTRGCASAAHPAHPHSRQPCTRALSQSLRARAPLALNRSVWPPTPTPDPLPHGPPPPGHPRRTAPSGPELPQGAPVRVRAGLRLPRADTRAGGAVRGRAVRLGEARCAAGVFRGGLLFARRCHFGRGEKGRAVDLRGGELSCVRVARPPDCAGRRPFPPRECSGGGPGRRTSWAPGAAAPPPSPSRRAPLPPGRDASSDHAVPQ